MLPRSNAPAACRPGEDTTALPIPAPSPSEGFFAYFFAPGLFFSGTPKVFPQGDDEVSVNKNGNVPQAIPPRRGLPNGKDAKKLSRRNLL